MKHYLRQASNELFVKADYAEKKKKKKSHVTQAHTSVKNVWQCCLLCFLLFEPAEERPTLS